MILQSGITEFINHYSPIILTDSDVIILSVIMILLIVLVWVISRHFKTKSAEYKMTKSYKERERNSRKTKKSPQKTIGKKSGRKGVVKEINLPEKKLGRKPKRPKKPDQLGGLGSNKKTLKDDKNPKSRVEQDLNTPRDQEGEINRKKSDQLDTLTREVEESSVGYESPESKESESEAVRTVPSKSSNRPVTGIRNNDSISENILFIGYEPTDKFSQNEEWKYPIVKMPEPGTVIRQPYHKKQQLRGYKEKSFQRTLSNAFSNSFDVLGDCVISTGSDTRPYEPDITVRRLRGNRNIFIDIEIDEPYGGISRSVTHTKREDDRRDFYFIDRGWIVIRFAEIQVHQQMKNCVAFICKVIHEIAPEINIPPSILNLDDPKQVEQWDQLQAEEWAKKEYRENYLDHTFGQIHDQNNDTAIEFSDLDKKTEELVKPTKYVEEGPEPVKGEVNHRNIVNRDKRIQFFPKEHLYLVDGIPAKSVSEVVARFFPAFDRLGISRKLAMKRGRTQAEILAEWDQSRDAGTFLHSQIENYFNGDSYQSPSAFNHFQDFMDEHSHLNTFRTEWRVFDTNKMLAGTIDYVAKNPDGTYSIYDWKRSKNVVDEYSGGAQKSHPFGTGFGPLSQLDSTAYNKYCLQQAIYKRILEKYYEISVRDMFLVVLHPRYSNYHKYQVDEYETEVDYILQNI